MMSLLRLTGMITGTCPVMNAKLVPYVLSAIRRHLTDISLVVFDPPKESL